MNMAMQTRSQMAGNIGMPQGLQMDSNTLGNEMERLEKSIVMIEEEIGRASAIFSPVVLQFPENPGPCAGAIEKDPQMVQAAAMVRSMRLKLDESCRRIQRLNDGARL